MNSKEMEAFASYLVKQRNDDLKIRGDRDMFRTLQSITYNKEIANVQPALPSAPYTWYPQTEFLYMKSPHYFFAAKGGNNNESDNHNAVGDFSLYVDTIPFFVDAGVGTYMRQTFSSERYSIWTMQSNYHNLPMINGEAQQFGAAYKSGNVSFDRSKNRFSLDISGAYAKSAAIKNWQRSYTLSAKGLKIEDAFELSEIKAPSAINFLVAVKPETDKDGVILLRKDGKEVSLAYSKQLFDVQVDAVPLDDTRLSNVWGKELYRVRLVCKSPQLKGKYTFMINRN